MQRRILFVIQDCRTIISCDLGLYDHVNPVTWTYHHRTLPNGNKEWYLTTVKKNYWKKKNHESPQSLIDLIKDNELFFLSLSFFKENNTNRYKKAHIGLENTNTK